MIGSASGLGHRTQPHGGPPIAPWILALFAASFLVVAWRVAEYLVFAAAALAFPYGLDFAEGIVWQQALLMPGPRMYGDIATYPYIVFHYTPLYHGIVRLVALTGADIMIVGRVLSIASTLAAAVFIGFASRRILADQNFPPKVCAWLGALAGLLLLTYKPIWLWSVLVKPDSMAMAFTLAGFFLMLGSAERRWRGHAAMILFVLGVFTKQTVIAAPAAAMLVWLLRDWRRAVEYGLTGLCLGVAATAAMTYATNGGFLRHIIFYNINPYSLRLLRYMVSIQYPHGIFAILIAAGSLALMAWGRAVVGIGSVPAALISIRQDARAFRLSMLLLYLGFAAVFILAMGKSGGSINYLMEAFAVGAVAISVVCAWSMAERHSGALGSAARWRRLAPLVPAALLVQLIVLPAPVAASGPAAEAVLRERDELVAMVRAAQKPVVSDEMVILMRAGREVPIETQIFRDLQIVGVWDPAPFVNMILRQEFEFLLLDGEPGRPTFDGRYPEIVAQAILKAYPIRKPFGGFVLYSPAETAAPTKP